MIHQVSGATDQILVRIILCFVVVRRCAFQTPQLMADRWMITLNMKICHGADFVTVDNEG